MSRESLLERQGQVSTRSNYYGEDDTPSMFAVICWPFVSARPARVELRSTYRLPYQTYVIMNSLNIRARRSYPIP